MNDDRWQRIEALFHAASEQPSEERRAWLAAQADGDQTLIAEVSRLLDCADEVPTALDDVVGRAAAELNQAALSPGQQLGSYRVVRRIGRGGMGEVYLAERDDQEYRHQVALKVIRGYAGEDAMERFRRERQILAALQHPHIARLLDGGTTEAGQPYLVMDHVEGLPLVRWIEEERPDLRERLRLFIRICEAIVHAHQHLIIHRDIKPGNVLMTARGDPVLVDFGIAKILNESEPGGDGNETDQAASIESDAAETLVQGYTPGYASPEQQAGRAVTTASDIYSLGCLLRTLIESAPANDSTTVPDELQAVVDKATRTLPSERYTTAVELRRELIRYLEQRPLQAMPRRWPYRLRKFLQRHRPAALAIGAMGLLLGPLLWIWIQESRRAEQAEQQVLIEARHGEQVLEFLLDTIAAAEPARAQGREVSVRDIVNQGRARILADDTLVGELRARLSLALGEVYLRLEDHAPAVELLGQATDSAVPATALRANSLIGFWLTLKNDLDGARPYLEQAMALVDRNPDLPPALVHEARNHQALWWLDQGQAREAADVFLALVEIHRAADRHGQLARMLHNAGLAQDALGNLEQAIAHFQESLQVKRETGASRTPSYANTQSALAQSLVMIGDYEAARVALEDSMALRLELFGADHPGLHHDANEYGSMLHDRGLFEQAIAQYQRAIELHAQAGNPEIGSATYLNNLASALEDRGDLAGAEPLFRRSLALRQSAYGPAHAAVARAQHNLARLLIKRGELEEARVLMEASIAAWDEVRGREHAASWYSRSLRGQWALANGEAERAVAVLGEVLAELRSQLSDSNWWVLTTRGLQARALIEAGQLDPAQLELQSLIADYRESLGAEHPMAAVWSLELARIELMRNDLKQADTRLRDLTALVEGRMMTDSRAVRQLRCLSAGSTGRQCWEGSAPWSVVSDLQN